MAWSPVTATPAASDGRDAGDVARADVAVIGAGAAGIMAALAARGAIAANGSPRRIPIDAPTVVLLDGQDPPGRKILISGGGRCNLTNAEVDAQDYVTSDPARARSVLGAFPPAAIRRLLADRGVATTVEPLGKVFPSSGRARDVLDALLGASADAGVQHRFGQVVTHVQPTPTGWVVDGMEVARVVLATGGRSVPATGSTGFGLTMLANIGHQLVAAVPALAPLYGGVGAELSGLSVATIVRVVDASDGRELARAAGSLLFTHRGVTGPAAFDVSHEVERAARDGRHIRVLADVWSMSDPSGPFAAHLGGPKLPGCCLREAPMPAPASTVDAALVAAAQASPRTPVATWLARRLPRRLAAALAGDDAVGLGDLGRLQRRDLARQLTALDLAVASTGGYARAEVTAGGVRLAELGRRTLESRLAPGLHACGEVCDVTGRLGGFNFQWAWASGYLAGRAAADAVATSRPPP